MSPSIPRQVRWKLFAHTPPPAAAFPEERAGRLLRYVFRGLLDVYSHCNLHAHRVAKTTLYTEGSSGFVTSAAASVITGWNEPVPGWGYLPLKSTGFPRRTAPRTLLRFFAVGSEVAHRGSPTLATVRRSNRACSFPAHGFHEDSRFRDAIEGIN